MIQFSIKEQGEHHEPKKTIRDYWQKHYQTFKAAGITQREYCRQNDLGYWTFNKWKRLFDQENHSTLLQQLPVKYQPAKPQKFEIIAVVYLTLTL